jgi:glycerol kinase
MWKNTNEIEELRMVDKTFHNGMNPVEIERIYNGWKIAVNRTRFKL